MCFLRKQLICSRTHMFTHVEARSQPGVLSLRSHHFVFWDRISHWLTRVSSTGLSRLASETWDLPVSACPVLDRRCLPSLPTRLLMFRDLNLGSNSWVERTLWIEHLPSHYTFTLKFSIRVIVNGLLLWFESFMFWMLGPSVIKNARRWSIFKRWAVVRGN